MKKIITSSLLTVFFLVLSIPCMATPQFVPTETVAGINLSVSPPPSTANNFSAGCNRLYLFATGPIFTYGQFVINGVLSCTAGDYSVIGNGYANTQGGVTMKMIINHHDFICGLNGDNLGGSCSIINAGWANVGSVTLAPLP